MMILQNQKADKIKQGGLKLHTEFRCNLRSLFNLYDNLIYDYFIYIKIIYIDLKRILGYNKMYGRFVCLGATLLLLPLNYFKGGGDALENGDGKPKSRNFQESDQPKAEPPSCGFFR